MRKSTRSAFAVAAAFGAAVIGYGAASATDTGARAVTRPDTPPVQHIPHTGPGASPRPPARPDSVFVPIKACRIVYTQGHGGKIANGGTRSFYVVGSTGFPGQGGASTGCGIPSTATAISARLNAFGGPASGHLTVYPTGAATNLPILFYPKATYASTAATLALADGTGTVLTVKNTGGPTQLSIDVYGYYDEQIEGMITPSGAVYSGSNHIVSATLISTGIYRVTLDRDVSYCTPTVDTYSGKGVYGSAYAFAGTSVYVYTWYISGSTHLEVSNSYYFYLTVNC
jgi:hypothetical protein